MLLNIKDADLKAKARFLSYSLSMRSCSVRIKMQVILKGFSRLGILPEVIIVDRKGWHYEILGVKFLFIFR